MSAKVSTNMNPFDGLYIHPIYIHFKNALWNFRIRRRAIHGKLHLEDSPALLEIGSGIAPIIPARANVVYTDLSPLAAGYLKKKYPNVNSLVAPAENLPFTDNHFDCVVSSEVLEHVSEDMLAVSEMARVLKPGGRLLLTVPVHSYFFTEADRFVGHLRRYDPEMLWRMLSLNGFENIQIKKIAGPLDLCAMRVSVALFRIMTFLFAKKHGVRSKSGALIMQLFFPVYWLLNLAYTFFVNIETFLIPIAWATIVLVVAEKHQKTN